jgi:hypothetical protein
LTAALRLIEDSLTIFAVNLDPPQSARKLSPTSALRPASPNFSGLPKAFSPEKLLEILKNYDL